MSANRDRDLKTTFVFNNLYELYKRGQANGTSTKSLDKTGVQHGQVIKAGDVNAGMMGLVTVRKFQPASFIGKRVETARVAASVAPAPSAAPTHAGAPRAASPILKPSQLPATDRAQSAAPGNPVIDNLKKNLAELQDLHGRLRFMLTELEDLVRDKK